MSTRTITITLPADVVDFYEAMLEERGETAQARIAYAVRTQITSHIQETERAQDPAQMEFINAVSSLVGKGDGPNIAARVFGRDRWPWTGVGRPENLKAAHTEARRRGKALAKSNAQTNALIQQVLYAPTRAQKAEAAEKLRRRERSLKAARTRQARQAAA